MLGYLTSLEEWVYPDTPLEKIQPEIDLHSPLNGEESIKLLYGTDEEYIHVELENSPIIEASIHEMVDVYVQYNEIEKEVQDGLFVSLDPDSPKPDFCTRKAPFRVYEALQPSQGKIKVQYGHAPIYLSFKPKPGVKPGVYDTSVHIKTPHGQLLDTLNVHLHVYDVMIPKESLQISNWFNLKNMSTYHGHLDMHSSEFLSMVRKYAKLMRVGRQTHFYIELSPDYISYVNEQYDFSFYKPIIDIFFEEGFETLELGNLLTKGDNLFTDSFKCAFDPSITFASSEGYKQMTLYINSMKSFLETNHWDQRVVFHIVDEPDVHVAKAEDMEIRKRDYFQACNLLRRALPYCKVIEAVKTTEFKSGVDVWVPLTASYEEQKQAFDALKDTGDDIWIYVCCVPTGTHLNRFLDIALLKSRLLFWGIRHYNLKGYLHWGLNQQPHDNFDPFENSNTPNIAFNGVFPSGDAFMVYPEDSGPLSSMRFEAQRKGAEDYELLTLLKEKSPTAYQQIIHSIFNSFTNYNDNAKVFDKVRIELLQSLSQ